MGNNFEGYIANGEIGIVCGPANTSIPSKPKFGVEFSSQIGNVFEYSSADFNDDTDALELAYALTVHKSQGSEFDYVFMPMINEHEFTLNKNLLYTGITRTKNRVFLFGSDKAVEKACKNVVERTTGLS
jgi:exodeoxyribonuclease V alpha subunit